MHRLNGGPDSGEDEYPLRRQEENLFLHQGERPLQRQGLRPLQRQGDAPFQYEEDIPRSRFRTHHIIMPIVSRFVLLLLFFLSEGVEPFQRIIQPEELWLYRYPITKVSFLEQFAGPFIRNLLEPVSMIMLPMMLIVFVHIARERSAETLQAVYAYLLSVPVTGITVNIIKIFVGRPRPDFLARCYGESQYMTITDMSKQTCVGNADDYHIMDGRRSFPSGHSALAACCFGFMIYYLSGQLKLFYYDRGNNRQYSLFVIAPLLITPILVAIARTCDYRHHWQDVVVGSIIGFVIAYICYREYFPALTAEWCQLSYQTLEELEDERNNNEPETPEEASFGFDDDDDEVYSLTPIVQRRSSY